MHKLNIVIPVMNEEGSVGELIERIHTSLKDKKIDYVITIVDDFSTDDTQKNIFKLAGEYPIHYYLKTDRPGKAYSILQGAESEESEFVIMIDGDLQYAPEYIPRMLAATGSSFQPFS